MDGRMSNAHFIQIIFISCALFFVATGQRNHENCADGDVKKCYTQRAMQVDKRAETNDKGADNMDSDHNALQQLKQQAIGDNDQLGDLLDLNSEPAVEDLMRQIMSQAKLWEAIQEANREMVIQKDVRDANTKEHFPLAFSAQ